MSPSANTAKAICIPGVWVFVVQVVGKLHIRREHPDLFENARAQPLVCARVTHSQIFERYLFAAARLGDGFPKVEQCFYSEQLSWAQPKFTTQKLDSSEAEGVGAPGLDPFKASLRRELWSYLHVNDFFLP